MTLAAKLHPDRFSAMSGKMAAIVGYIVGESWTEPEIAALSVTSDGFVLTDAEFFGEAADLDRNLLNLLVALSSREKSARTSSAVTASESTIGGRCCQGRRRPRVGSCGQTSALRCPLPNVRVEPPPNTLKNTHKGN